jgi:hypothetical protein
MPTNTKQVANVFSSDTLNTWREKTNELIKIVNAIPGVPIGSLNRRGGVIDGQSDSIASTIGPEGTLLVIAGPSSTFAPSVGVGDYAAQSSWPAGPESYTLSINRIASGAWANVELTADKTGISANGISITNGLLTIDVHASDLIGANSNDAVITIGAGDGVASRGTLGDPNIINLWDSQTGLPSINAYGFGVNDQTLGYTSFEQHAFFTKRSRQNTDNPDIQRLFTINATGIFTQSNTFVLTAQTPATGDLYVQGNAHFGTSYNGVVISNNMVQIDTLADANPAIDLTPSTGHTNTTRDTDKIRIWSSGSDTMGFGVSVDSLDYVASANHVFHTGSTGALGENAVINSLGIYATTDITAGSDVIATGNVVATNVYVGASEGVVISNALIEIDAPNSNWSGINFDAASIATHLLGPSINKINFAPLINGAGTGYGIGVRSGTNIVGSGDITDYLSDNHVFSSSTLAGAPLGSAFATINATGVFSTSQVTAPTGFVTGLSHLLTNRLSINSGQSVLGSTTDTDAGGTNRSLLTLSGGANVAAIVVDSPSTSTAINPNILEITQSGINANTYGIGHWPDPGRLAQTYHAALSHMFYIDRPGNDNIRREVLSITNSGGLGAIEADFTANATFTGDISYASATTTGITTTAKLVATGADPSTFAHPIHVSGAHINSTSYLTPGAAAPSLIFTGATFINDSTIDRIDLLNSAAGTVGIGVWHPTAAAAGQGIMFRSKNSGVFGFYCGAANLTANIAPGGIETGGYVNAVGGFDTTGNIYSSGNPWFVGATNNISLGAGTITAASANFSTGQRIHVATSGSSAIGLAITSTSTSDSHVAISLNSSSRRAIDLSQGGIWMKKGLFIDGSERITQAGKVNATAFELTGSDLELGTGTSLNLFSTTSNLYVGGNAQFGSAASNGVAVLAGVPRSADVINVIDLNHGATTNNEYGIGLNLGDGDVTYHAVNAHSFHLNFGTSEEKMTVNSTGLFVHGTSGSTANIYADHIHGTSTTTGTSTATNLDLTGDIDTEGSLFVGSSVAGLKDGNFQAYANGLSVSTQHRAVFQNLGTGLALSGGAGQIYSSLHAFNSGKYMIIHGLLNNGPQTAAKLGGVASPCLITSSIDQMAINVPNGGINAELYKVDGADVLITQSTGKANLVNIQTVAATQYDMYNSTGTGTFTLMAKSPTSNEVDFNGSIRNITLTGNILGVGGSSEITARQKISATSDSAGGGIVQAKQQFQANNILTISAQDTGKANLVNIESVVAERYFIGSAEIVDSGLAAQFTELDMIDAGAGTGNIIVRHKLVIGKGAGGGVNPITSGGLYIGPVQVIDHNRDIVGVGSITGGGTITSTAGALISSWATSSTTNAVHTHTGRITSNSTAASAFFAPFGGIQANSYTTIDGFEVINSAGEISVPSLKSGTGTTSMLTAGAIVSTEQGPIVSDGALIANNTGSGTALTVPTGTIDVADSTSADAIKATSGGISANTGFSSNGALIIDSQPSGNVNIGFVDNLDTANFTTTSNVSMSTIGTHEVSIVGSEITNTFDGTGRLIINAHSTSGGVETIHLKGTGAAQVAAIKVSKDNLAAAFTDSPVTLQSRVSFQSGTNNQGPESFKSWAGGMSAKLGFTANGVLVIAPQNNGRSDLQNIGAIGANAISISGASVISTGVSGTSADIGNIRNFKSIGTTSTSIDTDGGISSKTGYWSNTEQIIVPTATGSNINNIDDVSTQTLTVGGVPFVTSGRNISAGTIDGSTITASSDLVTTSGAIKTGATTRISSAGAFTGTSLDVGPTNIISSGDLVVESVSGAGAPSIQIIGTASKIAAVRVSASTVGSAYTDAPPSLGDRVSFLSQANATGPDTFRSWGGGISAKTGFSANTILTINPTVTGRSNLEKIERINAVSIAMEGASTSNVIAVFTEGFGTSMGNIKQIGGMQNADNSYQDMLVKGKIKNYGTQTLWLPVGSFFDIAGTDPSTLSTTGGSQAAGTTAPHYGSPYSSRTFVAPQDTAFTPANFKSVFTDIVFPTSWAGPGSNVSVIGTYSLDGVPDFSVNTTQQAELMYTLHCVKNMEPTGTINGTANSQTVAEGVCVQRLSSVSSYGSINTQYTGHDNHASANCHIKVPTRVASNTAIPLISSYSAAEQDPSQYRWILRIHRRTIIDSIGNGSSPAKASTGLEASGFTSSVAATQINAGIKLMGVSVQYETTHLTDTPLGDYKGLS